MPSFDEVLADRIERFMQKQSRKLVLFWDTRWGEVVIKAIGKLAATGVTLFVVWHEFPELAARPGLK